MPRRVSHGCALALLCLALTSATAFAQPLPAPLPAATAPSTSRPAAIIPPSPGATTPAAAANPIATASPSAGTTSVATVGTSLHLAIFAITVNKEAVSDGLPVLFDAANNVYATKDDISDWRLKPPTADPITYRSTNYYPLSAYSGATVAIDTHKTMIALTVPPQYFDKTMVTMDTLGDKAYNPLTTGLFLTYDLIAQKNQYQNLLRGTFDFGLNFKNDSSLRANAISNGLSLSGSNFSQFQAYWTRDNLLSRSTVTIGDVTTGQSAFSSSIPLGGLTWGTDFSIEPGFVTYPMPVISGIASGPSTFSTIVNGQPLGGNGTLPIGPFTINSLPVMSGAGNIGIIVKDANGQQTILQQSYYVSTNLYKKGLRSFSYSAGLLENLQSVSNPTYGSPIVTATERRGITDRLTLEDHAQLGGGYNLLSIDATVAAGLAGIFNLGAAASAHDGAGGSAFLGGYTYQGRRFSAQLQANRYSANFSQLPNQLGTIASIGIQSPTATTTDASSLTRHAQTQLQANLTYSAGNEGVSAAYNSTSGFGQPANTLSYAYRLNLHNANLSLDWTPHTTFGGSSTSLSYSATFGPRTNVSATRSVSPLENTSTFTLQEGANQSANSTAYNLSYTVPQNNTPTVSTNVFHGSPLLNSQLTLTSTGNQTSGQLELNGSLAYVDHGFYLSPPIRTNTFGIVEIPNMPGITVYLQGQELGKTNKRGEILLPNLVPFMDNRVSIDQDAIPMTESIVGSGEAAIVPRRNGVAVATFHIQRNSDIQLTPEDSPTPAPEPAAPARPAIVSVTLHDTKGKALPAGIVFRDQDDTIVTNTAGRVTIHVADRPRIQIIASKPPLSCVFDTVDNGNATCTISPQVTAESNTR